jgi:uncharacterized protein YkwD
VRACVAALVLCATPVLAGEPPRAWSDVVGREPPAAAPFQGLEAALYAACGVRSPALETLAARLVAFPVPSTTRPSASELALDVERAGLGQPWPRAWAMTGPSARIPERFRVWLVEPRGTRRCGIARRVASSGEETVAALTIDALAELAPLARRVRVGAWIPLEATLSVEASEAAVVLLGPDGVPRRVLADLAGGVVRSRFSLDAPGEWKVQVLATLASGPEPVLEARLFAGVEPSSAPQESPPSPLPDDARIADELNAARRAQGLAPLRRSAALDTVAAAHAATMAATGNVAHDAGDGDPVERVRAAGIEARIVGENVARAGDAASAHRALWESPSHRGNMLSSRFGRVGIGVFRDRRGLWVTQVFAD